MIYVFRVSRKHLLVFSILALALLAGIISGPLIATTAGATRLIPVYSIETQEKVVALTFDISWGTLVPEPVLKILQEKEVTSTFFLSGPWVERNQEIALKIKEGGHEIASHGQRHVNLSGLSASEIQTELLKASRILEEVLEVKPWLLRTPNGDYNNKVIQAAEGLGYTVIQWGTDSLDWTKPGTNAIVDRVLKKVHPGDIILFHASDSATDTPEALPLVIDALRKQGYRFVPVSELLKLDPQGRWQKMPGPPRRSAT
ncbi:MAG: polysaccharide deacetylase family protein [Firmicutes bacterium]|nr:polysaccharide deacetylase family protein [Bacillota bacterium]MDD4263020.1 polysaccharide deacetylase family protein [Bacillota bacterium]MDD4693259.1 polysaccharide deacetylase family protein [Bacillota bacterium]